MPAARLPRRPAHARGTPRPAKLARAGRVDFDQLPARHQHPAGLDAGDLALDAGVGLLAGLGSLPKATAAARYSYKLDHSGQ